MGYSFDGPTKVISLTPGTVEIEVKDLYSRWKEWAVLSDNSKYLPAMRSVGGDPISDVKTLGATYFITNDWRIRPQEADHRLTVNGNLYTEPAGFSPFVPTLGDYNVLIEMQVSSLVDSSLAQITEIEQAAFNGRVTIDVVNGAAGTGYPLGTYQFPVSNLTDAKAIALTRGFDSFYVLGNLTIASGEDISNLHFFGQGATYNVKKTTITLAAGCITSNTFYHDMQVVGTQNGESHYYDCLIGALTDAHCLYENCQLVGPITSKASIGASHTTDFNRCRTGKDVFELNVNGAPMKYVFTNFSGHMIIKNCTNASTIIHVHMDAGDITVDSSCTAGTIAVGGAGVGITDNSTGTVIDTSAMLIPEVTSLKNYIESQRPTHQAFGKRLFVDPVSGSDLRNGTSEIAAVKTITKAISLAVSGRGDAIFILAPSAGVVTIDERVVIDKEDLHIRGPGRGVQFQPSTPNLGDVITIDAEKCSFSGFIVRAPAGSTTDNCITINSKFALFKKLYLVGTQAGSGNGFLFRGGDYHEIYDCESEKMGGSGLKTVDAGLASGSPREITVSGGNYYLNNLHGIELTSNTGASVGTSTRLIRIRGANVHNNLGYGLTADSNSTNLIIDTDTMFHQNTLGDIQSTSPSLIQMSPARSVWMANASEYANAGSMGELQNAGGLTPTQQTMLVEMYNLLGLDPTKPLLVTDTSRVVGDGSEISQTITSTPTQTTVTRV